MWVRSLPAAPKIGDYGSIPWGSTKFTMVMKKQNRIKSKQPSKSKFWCGCDMQVVGHSGKCPNCGNTQKGRKFKKPGPIK